MKSRSMRAGAFVLIDFDSLLERASAEDEVRAVLGGWEYEAEGELAYLTARNAGSTPVLKEEALKWNIHLAEHQLKFIPLVLDAAARGDTWTAVLHAMLVGVKAGYSQAEPEIYHARRKIRIAVTERSSAGGLARKDSPKIKNRQTEALRVFREEHARFGHKPFSEICQRVADKTGYRVKSIRRIAEKNDLRF